MSTSLAIRSSCSLCCSVQLSAYLLLAVAILPKAATCQSKDVSRSRQPIASVAGEGVYQDDLPTQVLGQLQEAQQHEYDLIIGALQEVVRQKLLTAEANKRGLTSERFLQQEVDSKIADPTAGEVEAFYLGQKGHDRRSLDEVNTAVQQDLKMTRIQAAREAFLHSLQQKAEIQILLQRPKVDVKYDSARLKGSPTAQVVIVEFSDFSCPFCRQAESTLRTLLAKYHGKVSVAYRDFPLRHIHPQAELAAEASHCAEAEGRFWEYHDLLFANSESHKRDDLLKFASDLTLDQKRFSDCLDGGLYRLQVENDVNDGIRAGVSATPAFFINGIFLRGAQSSASFEEIIDEELAQQTGPKVNARK